jgi:beta-glucosidase-like glycosyl hydrolase
MVFGAVKNTGNAIKAYEKQQKAYLKAQEAYRKLKSGKTRTKLTPQQKQDKADLKEARKLARELALFDKNRVREMKGLPPLRKISKEEKEARKLARELASFDKVRLRQMKGLAPITEEQKAKRRAYAREYYQRKKGRTLQALADNYALPITPRAPLAPPRVRVVRGGGGVPRMPSIRSQVANQAF